MISFANFKKLSSCLLPIIAKSAFKYRLDRYDTYTSILITIYYVTNEVRQVRVCTYLI